MKFLKRFQQFNKSNLKSPAFFGVVLFVSIVVLAISFSTVYAGLFSIFSPEEVTAETKNKELIYSASSQTISLLQAAVNTDPNPNKMANIAPIANNALVPEIAASNATDTDQTTEISTYIVREGDTVSGIAKMFGVSVNTVLWANNLTSKSVLRPGNTLVILPVSGIMYTVKKGDTISQIAKKYKADTDEITAYNDLSVSSLTVGQTIIIPDVELNQSSSNSSSLSISKGLPYYPGYFIRPISIGYRSQKLHGHNGIDLAAPIGTPIYASAAGTVIISRINGAWNGGYGNFVTIAHTNNTQTLYAHLLNKIIVEAGDRVEQGQVIGYIGMTGKTTGPHLHFEIRGAKNSF